jgi:hypothetical protein
MRPLQNTYRRYIYYLISLFFFLGVLSSHALAADAAFSCNANSMVGNPYMLQSAVGAISMTFVCTGAKGSSVGCPANYNCCPLSISTEKNAIEGFGNITAVGDGICVNTSSPAYSYSPAGYEATTNNLDNLHWDVYKGNHDRLNRAVSYCSQGTGKSAGDLDPDVCHVGESLVGFEEPALIGEMYDYFYCAINPYRSCCVGDLSGKDTSGTAPSSCDVSNASIAGQSGTTGCDPTKNVDCRLHPCCATFTSSTISCLTPPNTTTAGGICTTCPGGHNPDKGGEDCSNTITSTNKGFCCGSATTCEKGVSRTSTSATPYVATCVPPLNAGTCGPQHKQSDGDLCYNDTDCASGDCAFTSTSLTKVCIGIPEKQKCGLYDCECGKASDGTQLVCSPDSSGVRYCTRPGTCAQPGSTCNPNGAFKYTSCCEAGNPPKAYECDLLPDPAHGNVSSPVCVASTTQAACNVPVPTNGGTAACKAGDTCCNDVVHSIQYSCVLNGPTGQCLPQNLTSCSKNPEDPCVGTGYADCCPAGNSSDPLYCYNGKCTSNVGNDCSADGCSGCTAGSICSAGHCIADTTGKCSYAINIPPYTGPIVYFDSLLASIFKILYPVGIGLGLFMIIRAGYKIMTSEGNPQQIKEGQEELTSSVLGILFIILSLVILRVIIKAILGVNSI